jgi:hypothetical protein
MIAKLKKMFILLIFGMTGWMLCGAVFYLSNLVFNQYISILIHFILAPFIFYVLAYIYFKNFNLTNPIQTALCFTGIVILFDVSVVALLLEKSFDMFTSLMGTWLPFLFIFLSILLTGLHLTDKRVGK